MMTRTLKQNIKKIQTHREPWADPRRFKGSIEPLRKYFFTIFVWKLFFKETNYYKRKAVEPP